MLPGEVRGGGTKDGAVLLSQRTQVVGDRGLGI